MFIQTSNFESKGEGHKMKIGKIGGQYLAKIFLIIIFALFPIMGYATTYTVTSCTAASVQSAVNSAASGDSVYLNCSGGTWSSLVTITKSLTIYGNGDTSTVITGNNSAVFEINMSSHGNVRLSNMGFNGAGGSIQLETTMINLRGVLDYIRLDHLRFTDIQYHAVYIGLWDAITASPKVLFDHITYSSSLSTGWQRFLKIEGNNSTWKSSDRYGTDDFVFIEDSTFTWTGAASPDSGVTDAEHGVRLVVRHNTISGGGVQVHDTGSTQGAKGTRVTEVYNNIFTCTISGCSSIPAIGIRGGGWLIHDNSFATGYWVPGYPQIYRATVNPGFLGISCNGTSVAVCDTPNYYHCSGGDHAACGYPNDSACNGKGSCVTTAASSADCPTGTSFIPNLDRADGGSGASGYPCRHQTGWGQENSSGTTQSPSPVYWWGNTLNGSAYTFSYDVSPWFLSNRDYCNHDPSTSCGTKTGWTYTDYTYPHPLTTGSTVIAKPNAPVLHP